MSFERSGQAKGDVPEALRERHDAAPLLEERDEYLNYLLHRGTSTRRVVVSNRLLRQPINYLAAPKCLPTHGARSVYPPCVRAPTSQFHPYAQTKRRRGPSHTLRIDQVREYDSDGH